MVCVAGPGTTTSVSSPAARGTSTCGASESSGPVETTTVASSVAVIRRLACAGKSPRSWIHSPSAGPGVGHHAVRSSPSTAAVIERAGSAPPKLVASAAELDAATRPPCSSTRVNGPADG